MANDSSDEIYVPGVPPEGGEPFRYRSDRVDSGRWEFQLVWNEFRCPPQNPRSIAP
jgi:hypothetical protein